MILFTYESWAIVSVRKSYLFHKGLTLFAYGNFAINDFKYKFKNHETSLSTMIIQINLSKFKISYRFPRKKDDFLKILFYDGNQVDDRIASGLAEGFLYIHLSFVC